MNAVFLFTLRVDDQAALEFNILFHRIASILSAATLIIAEKKKKVVKSCILMLPIAGSLGSRLVLRLLLLQCADASRAPACSSKIKIKMNDNCLHSAPLTLLVL